MLLLGVIHLVLNLAKYSIFLCNSGVRLGKLPAIPKRKTLIEIVTS